MQTHEYAVAGYHVYGVHNARYRNLFVDYLINGAEHYEEALLQQLRILPSQPLACLNLRKDSTLSDACIFEIELVDSLVEAVEAVTFWRDYFRAIGEVIVDGGHMFDRLAST